MKSSDRILAGIVAAIVLLVVIAFVVTSAQPEETYRGDGTPEGVAHDYLLAIQREDDARAYGYLSPSLPGYPESVAAFSYDLGYWTGARAEGTTLDVQSVTVDGGEATVYVLRTHYYGGGLFGPSEYSNVFAMQLRLEGTEWKITNADEYFAWTWVNPLD